MSQSYVLTFLQWVSYHVHSRPSCQRMDEHTQWLQFEPSLQHFSVWNRLDIFRGDDFQSCLWSQKNRYLNLKQVVCGAKASPSRNKRCQEIKWKISSSKKWKVGTCLRFTEEAGKPDWDADRVLLCIYVYVKVFMLNVMNGSETPSGCKQDVSCRTLRRTIYSETLMGNTEQHDVILLLCSCKAALCVSVCVCVCVCVAL